MLFAFDHRYLLRLNPISFDSMQLFWSSIKREIKVIEFGNLMNSSLSSR